MSRNVTDAPHDPRERFALYRLCDCPTCEGRGKVPRHLTPYAEFGAAFPINTKEKCPECRGEGRIRQELASCESPEAVGVAIVTLAREGEWEDCPFGLLDRMPECPECEGRGYPLYVAKRPVNACRACKGSGIKSTGTWLVLPWTSSARNLRDAARTLARSKKSSRKP